MTETSGANEVFNERAAENETATAWFVYFYFLPVERDQIRWRNGGLFVKKMPDGNYPVRQKFFELPRLRDLQPTTQDFDSSQAEPEQRYGRATVGNSLGCGT